eukprot:80711-Chlamydomonas_euryale.AAC.1
MVDGGKVHTARCSHEGCTGGGGWQLPRPPHLLRCGSRCGTASPPVSVQWLPARNARLGAAQVDGRRMTEGGIMT